jgi:hypothetical protein
VEIDDAIVQLGAKLDAWLDNNLATIPSMDRVAQFKALLAGIEVTKEGQGIGGDRHVAQTPEYGDGRRIRRIANPGL